MDARRKMNVGELKGTRMRLSRPDLLFDVDGVLIYPAMQFRDYLDTAHGITPEMTAPFFHGRFLECARGRANLREELQAHLASWGWAGTSDSFIENWMEIDSKPDTEILELVASLRQRGFPCHVASVQEQNRAAYLRDFVGFNRAFDKTFFSCDLGAVKPDRAFYRAVEQRLERPPKQLMLIDDSPACIDAAREIGWQTFQYQGPADLVRLIKVFDECDCP